MMGALPPNPRDLARFWARMDNFFRGRMAPPVPFRLLSRSLRLLPSIALSRPTQVRSVSKEATLQGHNLAVNCNLSNWRLSHEPVHSIFACRLDLMRAGSGLRPLAQAKTPAPHQLSYFPFDPAKAGGPTCRRRTLASKNRADDKIVSATPEPPASARPRSHTPDLPADA